MHRTPLSQRFSVCSERQFQRREREQRQANVRAQRQREIAENAACAKTDRPPKRSMFCLICTCGRLWATADGGWR
jgi:hypothetical protein